MGGWFGLRMIEAVRRGQITMNKSCTLTLLEESPIIYKELEARSEALLNATLMWVPISSIMWAGIIYAVFWLFR